VSLANRLTQTPRGKQGSVCRVCRFLIDLPKSDSATLRAALEGDVYTHKQIADALTAEGWEVSALSVGRHRRGVCRGVA
jgi:hypothetical protein